MIKRLFALFTAVVFVVVNIMPAAAQSLSLPGPREMVGLTAPVQPCVLKGLKLDPMNPFRFDFILDSGNELLSQEALKDESDRLIRHFLAVLTTPDADLWVNLSPYEDNRIIEENLGRTALGRDMLAQDYILKQLSASLLHPDSVVGKKFWSEVYRRAQEKFGTSDIPVNAFQKVWIIPDTTLIHEGDGLNGSGVSVYIDRARLKVMLETDYLAAAVIPNEVRDPKTPTDDISTAVMREIVIPVIEKEVNEGVNFAPLRKVYHSLLLAVWMKQKLQKALNPLASVYFDRHKTAGVEIPDPKAQVQALYARYVEAFQKGVYNLVREDALDDSQELIPRKYFSGGLTLGNPVFEKQAGDVSPAQNPYYQVVGDFTPAAESLIPVGASLASYSIQVDPGNIRVLGKDYDSFRTVGKVLVDDIIATVFGKGVPDKQRMKENKSLFLLLFRKDREERFFLDLLDYILAEAVANGADSIRERGGDGQVAIDVRKENGVLVVRVSDNGVGLNGRAPSDVMTQGSTKAGALEQHYGVGVSNSIRFLEAFGGAYSIEDKPDGRGAVVTVRVPLDAAQAAQAAQAIQGMSGFGFLAIRLSLAVVTSVFFPLTVLAAKPSPYPSTSRIVAMADPKRISTAEDVKTSVFAAVNRYNAVQAMVFGPYAWQAGVSEENVFTPKYLEMSAQDMHTVLQAMFPEQGDDFSKETQPSLDLRLGYLKEFRDIGFSRSDTLKIVMAIGGKESAFGQLKKQVGGTGSGLLQFDSQVFYKAAYDKAVARGLVFPSGADQLTYARQHPDVYLKVALVKLSSEVPYAVDIVNNILADKKLLQEVGGWFPGFDARTRTSVLLAGVLYGGWNAGVSHSDAFYLESFRAIVTSQYDVKKLHDITGAAKDRWEAERALNNKKKKADRTNEKRLHGEYLKALRAYNICHVVMQVYFDELFNARIIPEVPGRGGEAATAPAEVKEPVQMAKKLVSAPPASAPAAGAYNAEVVAAAGSLFSNKGFAQADRDALRFVSADSKRLMESVKWALANIEKIKGTTTEKKMIGLFHLAAQAEKTGASGSVNVTAYLNFIKNVDNAENVTTDKAEQVGGIDLNPAGVNMILRDGKAIDFKFTPEQLKMLDQNISGFVPVIFNVFPLASVNEFLK